MLITLLKKEKSFTSLDLKTLLLESNALYKYENYTFLKHYTFNIKDDDAKVLFNKKQYDINLYKEQLLNPPFPIEEIPEHYYQWKMSKRSNPRKKRIINAPDDILKNYQYLWKSFLENVLQLQAHNAAHGYVKTRGIATLMKTHQKAKTHWNLELDFKDFFPSHNKKYLKEMLLKIYPFKFLEEELLNLLIEYATLNDELPQGTPLSPILSNIAMVPIDYEFTNLLNTFNKKHFIYTRYSDNIYISCKLKFNPQKVIRELNNILKKHNSPLKIHPNKIKFGSHAGRNFHLGIMLNKDNNLTIGHKKNQKFRAMLYQFIQDNVVNENYWEKVEIQKMLGLISYYKSIEKNYIYSTIEKYNKKFHTDILRVAKELLK